MLMGFQDTIYALSSGSLPSGVAVVRVSGPMATDMCLELCGRVPTIREAELLSIRNRNKDIIDRGLVLFFKGPASFTGEDSIEFQVHGGRAVVSALLSTLASFPNVRHAEAGEFTRRALDHGKLDLVEVEGLSDLIGAETEAQRKLAIEQANGGLTDVYKDWARRLTHARAMIEAELDFADEADVPGSVADKIWIDMTSLLSDIDRAIANIPLGEIIRDGLKVVIYGAPNAGKSSLLNSLAKRDIAIVTEMPGTTRDVLQVDINIGGFLVHLKDTAGIRETSDRIEKEGISRAYREIDAADLILHLVDLSSDTNAGAVLDVIRCPVIKVGTKCDIAPTETTVKCDVNISTKTGEGIDSLMKQIILDLKSRYESVGGALPSRQRHLQHLTTARQALQLAIANVNAALEIRAENLRLAGDSLGKITGRVDTETLLGVIFSEFCIGK